MAVSRERFDSGMSYTEYKAQMTRNREQLEANERAVSLVPEDLAPFRALARPLHVLAIVEDWCGDVITALPVLGRLAAESGKLDVRVFPRDQHPDLMDQYLNQGQYRSIPVFAFFDEGMGEIGRFIERPASVTEARQRRRVELFAEHPEFGSPDTPPDQLPESTRAQVMEAMARLRADMTAFSNAEIVRELRSIVEGAPGA